MIQTSPRGEILTVDDNPLNLDLLGGLLRGSGYKVRAATSGARALDLARRNPPDLVMLDITMPEMDGYEACRQIKADPALRGIPVIFISALDDPLDKVRAFHSGGADYVTKPFQAEEVLARVEHQLRIAFLQRDLEFRNRSLEEANLRLQELDQLKAGFTAMLVHDLRTPLTAIGLALEVHRQEGAIPTPLLDQVEQCVRRLAAMLQELLDVFRSEGGGFPVDLEPLDPARLLEGLRATFEPLALRKGLVLEGAWEGLPSRIRGDAGKLERAFSNLLGNALKFTSPGGRIALRGDLAAGEGVDAGHHWMRVEVEDTGRGIPADHLPYVFDPYRQSARADQDLGVGLGLAIVQRIAAAHRGRVGVRSQPGVGTCFTMLLPLD